MTNKPILATTLIFFGGIFILLETFQLLFSFLLPVISYTILITSIITISLWLLILFSGIILITSSIKINNSNENKVKVWSILALFNSLFDLIVVFGIFFVGSVFPSIESLNVGFVVGFIFSFLGSILGIIYKNNIKKQLK